MGNQRSIFYQGIYTLSSFRSHCLRVPAFDSVCCPVVYTMLVLCLDWNTLEEIEEDLSI